MSLVELAAQSQLTKGALSKIETGVTSPPISTLMRIADALDVAIADFFVDPNTHPRVVVTRKGEGTIHENSRVGYSYEALAMEMRSKFAEPFVLTIRPEDPDNQFRHEGEEFVYMLSGQMDMTIDERTYKIAPGDSVYFDSGQLHSFRVRGKRPARFLCLFVHDKRASVTVHRNHKSS